MPSPLEDKIHLDRRDVAAFKFVDDLRDKVVIGKVYFVGGADIGGDVTLGRKLVQVNKQSDVAVSVDVLRKALFVRTYFVKVGVVVVVKRFYNDRHMQLVVQFQREHARLRLGKAHLSVAQVLYVVRCGKHNRAAAVKNFK